jgi:hypothetical protein
MYQQKFAVARHTIANTREAGVVQSVYGLLLGDYRVYISLAGRLGSHSNQ